MSPDQSNSGCACFNDTMLLLLGSELQLILVNDVLITRSGRIPRGRHFDAVHHLFHLPQLLNVHVITTAKAHPFPLEFFEDAPTFRVPFMGKVASHLCHESLPFQRVHAIWSGTAEVWHATAATGWARLALFLRMQLLPSADRILLIGLLPQPVLIKPAVVNAELLKDFLELTAGLHTNSLLYGLFLLGCPPNHERAKYQQHCHLEDAHWRR
mmetsp:Transcript_29280/g.68517  ORF Transcript_29280/g.68517 Transcript_29280/m.68517 type:complete len:212 (-) Transcript_29280:28-663(-)